MLKYILISFLIITNAYAYTCEEMGYTKTIADCPNGGLKCPAEPEKMFCCDPCGDGRAYKYSSANCSADNGLQLAGIECGGRWTECRECPSEYKYNKDNCRAPKILAGSQCANSYTGCVYPSKFGCIPTVGYIYYADDSCHADYDDTKEAIGVIVDANSRLVISLDEYKTAWNNASQTFYDIPELSNFLNTSDAILDMDGLSNTDKIAAFIKTNGQEHLATQYCINKNIGNKKWYLPALGQLNLIHTRVADIQNSLTNIPNAKKITTNDYYWSSTEKQNSLAYFAHINNGIFGTYHKHAKYITRCVFSF